MVVVNSFRDTNMPVWPLWWKIKTGEQNWWTDSKFCVTSSKYYFGVSTQYVPFVWSVFLPRGAVLFRMCNHIWELPNRRWWFVPCESILSSTNSPLLARGLGWVHPEKLNQRICTAYAHNLFAFLRSKLIYSRKAKLWYRFLLNYLGFLFRKRKIKQAKSGSIG